MQKWNCLKDNYVFFSSFQPDFWTKVIKLLHLTRCQKVPNITKRTWNARILQGVLKCQDITRGPEMPGYYYRALKCQDITRGPEMAGYYKGSWNGGILQGVLKCQDITRCSEMAGYYKGSWNARILLQIPEMPGYYKGSWNGRILLGYPEMVGHY